MVEADGGSRGNPGPAAYGAVVRDASTGDVLAEVAEPIGRATNNVAEYRGAIAGLRAASGLDPEAEVEVRMDSRLVVEQMSGTWKIKQPHLRPLAQDARTAFPAERVRWTWIPRELNGHADRLLNDALDAARGRRVPAVPAVPPDAAPGAAVAAPRVDRLAGWDEHGLEATLLLLRHGETRHTGELRFSGSGGADPGLVERGRAQAERSAAALAARAGIQAVVTSPLRRARETAEVVAAALGLDIDVDEGFAECAFGAWDGHTFAEVRERWPAELTAWLGSTSVAPPGGESFEEVFERVEGAATRLRSRLRGTGGADGRTVLVVTHVTPVKTLVRLALDAPAAAIYRMELLPASLSEIRYYAGGLASLRAFGVATHLGDAATPRPPQVSA